MTDRSVNFLIGILKDVPIKVGHLYIPVDFTIMDIKEDHHVPIVVGMPFLCIADTIIDVKRGTLSMEVGDKRIDLIMTTMMEDPFTEVSCYLVEVEKPSVEQKPPELGEKNN